MTVLICVFVKKLTSFQNKVSSRADVFQIPRRHKAVNVGCHNFLSDKWPKIGQIHGLFNLNRNCRNHSDKILIVKLLITLLSVYVLSCNSSDKSLDGGYSYPKNISLKDTILYFYPLKNIETKKRAFGDYYIHRFYERFQEPNLSLRAFKKATYRLTYSDAFGDNVIIVLSDNVLTIKKGNTSGLYTDGTSQLNPVEQLHLRILNRHYPIDEMAQSEKFKNYYDSLVRANPNLLDPAYYHAIYEKSFVSTNKEFTFSTTSVPLSKQQCDTLLKEINISGFWTLPYFIECNHAIADGFQFTLEANTENKYQVVTVNSCPNNVTKFAQVCQKIIKLANVDKTIDLIWQEKVDTIQSSRHDLYPKK